MAGTAHGSNQLAVRFFRTELPDTPENKAERVLTEMPPGSPMLGSYMPGGKETPLPGRRRAGPKNLPWRSWQDRPKSRKRKKKSALRSLMG
jgi:hypothetical protein